MGKRMAIGVLVWLLLSLASELLYKTDCEQTNREDLLLAVDYFDSLRACSDDLAFLDARAHYIKGVGSYERDSVVDACREYLQALEVMEDWFDEKELTGHKARFMALTYNRLGEMFSGQFESDLDYCCLYLMGLSDADISALMQRSYNTVTERNKKLKRIIGCENVLLIPL